MKEEIKLPPVQSDDLIFINRVRYIPESQSDTIRYAMQTRLQTLKEAIDVVEGLKRSELLHDEPDEIKRTIMITERTINIGYNQALSQVIEKLEDMKED